MAKQNLGKFNAQNLIIDAQSQDASWTKIADVPIGSEGIFFCYWS